MLPIRTTHHTFLESRHPEVTKNPYHVLSPEWSQKKATAHVLITLKLLLLLDNLIILSMLMAKHKHVRS